MRFALDAAKPIFDRSDRRELWQLFEETLHAGERSLAASSLPSCRWVNIGNEQRPVKRLFPDAPTEGVTALTCRLADSNLLSAELIYARLLS